MNSLINYFSKKHLLVNVIFFGLLILAVFAWKHIGKEELPEFESNWVRVSTYYPGASPEDVELLVTKPIEDELKSVSGLEQVTSTSSVGSSSIRIVLDDDYPNKSDVMDDLKDAVYRANLPTDVRDLPNIRQFKSSEKAILDVGFYLKGKRTLNADDRALLQQYMTTFINQVKSLPRLSDVDERYYIKPELQILVDQRKSDEYEIPLTLVASQIRENNLRAPIGSLSDKRESRVSLINEYEEKETLDNLVVRGNYGNSSIKLSEIAQVKNGFARTTSIFKINGHEGLFMSVKKSIASDIISAQKELKSFIKKFENANKDNLGIVLMDDESFAVRNRLEIVSSNAILGFFLIIIVLLIFMDFKSSFWVAMGIPFCAAFTLIIAGIVGYTINNMTLAGMIIVLGIVVDDAIIIAENIARHREEGMPIEKAAVVGAKEVFKPILASIITTCVAFVPLIFFEGFFGKLVAYIPLVVILMLVASLFESIFLLPSHLSTKKSVLDRFMPAEGKKNWFHRYERKYETFLNSALRFRLPILVLFICILGSSVYIFKSNMRFVMFPREESQEVIVRVNTKKGTLKDETAKLIQPIEDMFVNDKANVVGVRATIAQSRRGGQVRENQASILVEVFPADQRDIPLNKLIETWEDKSKAFEGIESVKFLKGRWGHSSGSAIELQIQENNDQKRKAVSEKLKTALQSFPNIKNVEIEKPILKDEYIFSLKQEQLVRLNVSPSKVSSTLRSFVEGSILYSINKGDEEIDVRITVDNESKSNIDNIKRLRVENNSGQLIRIMDLVNLEKLSKPTSIVRTDYKRSVMLYADIDEKSEVTPLEVAEKLEEEVFPGIQKEFNTTILQFKGEIEDSRESQGEFLQSIFIVIVMIFMILVVMFNSLLKPLLILGIVPFGLSGVIFTLYFHGMSVYGFFAAIGALGMIGVVINDAIVMIDKIESSIKQNESGYSTIAKIASTRLRPIILTTLTTVIGILPTAYGVAGHDSILAEMMLTMGWGLFFGTLITLLLIPIIYSFTIKSELQA